MITLVRTAIASPGRIFDLLAYSKEVAAIAKSATGKDVATASSFGGNANQICWMVQYESLAEMEGLMGKLMADPRYPEVLKKGVDILVPGSVRDQIWRSY